ncbi:metal-dependent transcriptional regulator [Saccharicrinis fermentans]|uniref:Iron-dependent repressor IdeR n=1 Tax=Saccharicrinis fermentans DSM 9555 = JCM 21142 TaxID=869213 RepID=W7YE66_9BACT|nr:metal-dependent transcriptional regulator [Saccharicrinis fermentans]GAF02751.1 iron-dependent repressor IdeR [Saccharicrinis fermentans DSM 9555 = JCM 21142]
MFIILQIKPEISLAIGLLVTFVFFWFIWPNSGGLALITKFLRNNKRVLLEDALKFIFDCEYNKMICNINSLSGNLNITLEKSSSILNQLTELELVTINHQSVSLTDEGRSYALRIVRIHRIWERYLADQTSIEPADWHNEADRIEHLVTEEETELLAAQMGNPVFDPHGDPIPTTEGILPKAKGVLLSALQEGEMGRIIHLEDEPKSIYEQLVVLGLYPGMQIYVIDVTEKKITFVANGEECMLTPLFAGYITIEKTSDESVRAHKYELLSSLRIGEEAEVLGISQNCRGLQRRRLMDLGMVPGSQISAVMKSASGDPMGYRVMGTTIGIRKQHADYVFVKRNE